MNDYVGILLKILYFTVKWMAVWVHVWIRIPNMWNFENWTNNEIIESQYLVFQSIVLLIQKRSFRSGF